MSGCRRPIATRSRRCRPAATGSGSRAITIRAADALDGSVATEIAIGPITFRHEPTGAIGEIAGHLHPKARVATRGRGIDRRCFAGDGARIVMPSFGAYTGGLSIRDRAFAKIFAGDGFHRACHRRRRDAHDYCRAVLLSGGALRLAPLAGRGRNSR